LAVVRTSHILASYYLPFNVALYLPHGFAKKGIIVTKTSKNVIALSTVLTIFILYLLQVSYSFNTGRVLSVDVFFTTEQENVTSFYFGVFIQILIGLSLLKGIYMLVKNWNREN